jgi:nitric oxide reductase subunit C
MNDLYRREEMKKLLLVLLLILVLALVACGGDAAPESSAPSGDAAAGEKVFSEVAAPACTTCHSLTPGEKLVGPSLATIGSDAGSRVGGQSAADYLHESVTDPNAFVVDGFPSNVMTDTYGSSLTEQQIEDLVAYMQTLK